MKRLYLTIVLFSLLYFGKAQTCSTLCNYDLLNGPFPFGDDPVIVTTDLNYGVQSPITDPQYRDVKYEACAPGAACKQVTINDLKYRVYYPSAYTRNNSI